MNITKGKIAKAQRCVIYGTEGIGKSTFAAQFPDPLFIDTEGSTSNMDVARLDKPTSYSFMLQQVDFVIQQKPCKTLVIDTIDWAESIVISHICKAENKKSIEDFGYGSGFIKLEEELGRFLNKLQEVVDVGINVVLTAHAQIKKFEQPDEMGAYDRYELKLGRKTTAKTSALVKEWADMVLFMNYKTYSVATDDKGQKHKAQGGQRTIYATHHPAWDAKNRHELPDEFPMDYNQIAHIFVNQNNPEPQSVSNTNTLTNEQVEQADPSQQETQSEQTAQSNNIPPEEVDKVGINHTGINGDQESQHFASELDPSIPQALRDLMQQNDVSPEEIDIVVSEKGYFPLGTPISNYPQEFIDGVLIGAWDQVYGMIKDYREKLPFN